ncbi:hypothetical protein LMG26857_03630 [Achromobacter anxifer]|nr:hypothetical protein LMG26857_03630 [Achromobacter anxifer]
MHSVKEFTVRSKSTQPIMSLTPAMLAKMLAARPESVSLVLAKKIQDYKQLTGKALSLDYGQQQVLLAHAGAGASGMWTNRYTLLPYPLSMVTPIFADGFLRRSLTESMDEDLALVESFHALLDTQLAAASPTSTQAGGA